jgi:hypothetical protein
MSNKTLHEYRRYLQPQKSYADQFRLTHTFTFEILKKISKPSIISNHHMAMLGHRDMLAKVEEKIEILTCSVFPDFSCSILYKVK